MAIAKVLSILPNEAATWLSSRKCVAFLGSGPSAGIYHDWRVLVNELCRECCGLTGDRLPDGCDDIEEFMVAAEEARSADLTRYHEYLGDHFSNVAKTSSVYQVLWQMPFKAYITSNFDPLMLRAGQISKQPCNGLLRYPELDRAKIDARCLFHIHGICEENKTPAPGTIVLSKSEFDSAYAPDSPLRQFLIPTFARECIFFIGCRLKEPGLKRVFEICAEQQDTLERLSGSKRPPKFIIRPEMEVVSSVGVSGVGGRPAAAAEQAMKEEDGYYQRLGITVVRYSPLNKEHLGLLRLIEPYAQLPPVKQYGGFERAGGRI